jgi:hypothetical protein
MNETYITLRMPSGHIERITLEQWRSLNGSANRQIPGAGRAKGNYEERCRCGQYTLGNASRQGHICDAAVADGQLVPRRRYTRSAA